MEKRNERNKQSHSPHGQSDDDVELMIVPVLFHLIPSSINDPERRKNLLQCGVELAFSVLDSFLISDNSDVFPPLSDNQSDGTALTVLANLLSTSSSSSSSSSRSNSSSDAASSSASSSSSSSSSSAVAKSVRQDFSPEARVILKKWFEDHKSYPYPSPPEKVRLADQTRLTFEQVQHWFINARSRQTAEEKEKRKRKKQQQMSHKPAESESSERNNQKKQKRPEKQEDDKEETATEEEEEGTRRRREWAEQKEEEEEAEQKEEEEEENEQEEAEQKEEEDEEV